MAEHGINREGLKRLLKAMSVERHAVDVLVGNYDGTTPIKKEVGVVYNNTKSSSYNADDYNKALYGYNNGSNHSINYVSEA